MPSLHERTIPLLKSVASTKAKIKEKSDRKAKLEQDITDKQENILLNTKCVALLTEASRKSRDNVKQHFEKIITDALQFVTGSSDYEFVIQEYENRKKSSYEFYVKSTVNGIECLQKPEDANGGGFVDIISVAMKYAYFQLFNDPKIMSGTLLYDEPGKMISAEMSLKFAEYVKFLGTNYGKQTIMITHNDSISNVADKTFTVVKNSKGISTVRDNTSTPVSFDMFDDINIDSITLTQEEMKEE